MKEKILTTPRSYGKDMPELFAQLEAAGYEVVRNTTGGILEKDAMKEMLADCVGVIVGVDPMDAEVLASAPKLRAIAKYGVGVDNIDMDYCKEHGIKVSRTVGANSEAVADYAMALMLAVARKVPEIDRKCRKLNWGKITTRDVSHATLGLFGLGAIGRHVAERAQGFGMKVIAYDPYWPEEFAREHGIERADAETIFKNADFISLHLPLANRVQHIPFCAEAAVLRGDIQASPGGKFLFQKTFIPVAQHNAFFSPQLFGSLQHRRYSDTAAEEDRSFSFRPLQGKAVAQRSQQGNLFPGLHFRKFFRAFSSHPIHKPDPVSVFVYLTETDGAGKQPAFIPAVEGHKLSRPGACPYGWSLQPHTVYVCSDLFLRKDSAPLFVFHAFAASSAPEISCTMSRTACREASPKCSAPKEAYFSCL